MNERLLLDVANRSHSSHVFLSPVDIRMTKEEFEVHLFTDGACSGNPGPGGWAYILRHLPTGTESEESGGCQESTNNRMELQAVIEGLTALKRPCRVELFTDSTYVGKGITEWMGKWKANQWRRRENGVLVPPKNEDLWRLLDVQVTRHRIKYTRVAGHSGHAENDRCDELAVEASHQFRKPVKPSPEQEK